MATADEFDAGVILHRLQNPAHRVCEINNQRFRAQFFYILANFNDDRNLAHGMKKTARPTILPLRLLNSEFLRNALIQFPQREAVDLDADDDKIRTRQSLGTLCRIFQFQFGIAMFK